MKESPYLHILLLLLLSGVIVIGLGLGLDVEINGVKLVKPNLTSYFKPDSVSVSKTDTQLNDTALKFAKDSIIKQGVAQNQTQDSTMYNPMLKELNPYKLDTSKQRILMIGESMIEGLYLAFLKYGKVNGHTVKAKIWYGSRLLDWGAGDTLQQLINQFNPSFIFFSCGSNELYIRNIWERKEFTERIVNTLKPYRYVWIGPPIPKKDYGIDSMYRVYNLKGAYYSSKHHKFKRKKDGVHPKKEESFVWADSIAHWIMNDSRYPILLHKNKKMEKDTIASPLKTQK